LILMQKKVRSWGFQKIRVMKRMVRESVAGTATTLYYSRQGTKRELILTSEVEPIKAEPVQKEKERGVRERASCEQTAA